MITTLLLSTNLLALSASDLNNVANAIYLAEGGNKTKHPYGILSCHTSNPRHTCIVTIQHSFAKWKHKQPFIDFLADSYCPSQCDPTGNKNWKKNVRYFLTKKETRKK